MFAPSTSTASPRRVRPAARSCPARHLIEPWAIGEDERLVDVGVGFNRARPGPVAGAACSTSPAAARSAGTCAASQPASRASSTVRRRPPGHRRPVPRPHRGTDCSTRTDDQDGPGLPAQGRRTALACRRRRARRGRPAAQGVPGRGDRAGQPVLPRPLPRLAAGFAGMHASEHTAQVPPHDRRARGGVPRGRPAAAVLLADDGARRRHRHLNAVGHAQRATDPGQLRPALRPGRPLRPAGARPHLLRHRQRPRQLLVPPLPATWSPAR